MWNISAKGHPSLDLLRFHLRKQLVEMVRLKSVLLQKLSRLTVSLSIVNRLSIRIILRVARNSFSGTRTLPT